MEAAKTTARAERLTVMLLCLLGAVHVFFFSAAFPFFSVNDEQTHFDLVVRYSQGDIPRSFASVSDEALPFIAIYGTPEYLWPPATQPGGKIAQPPWKLPVVEARDQLVQKEAGYRAGFKNYEAASPPLYYAIAGGWWKFGKWLKLDGGHLLYFLRFLNVPFIVALVLVGWFAAGAVFPEKIFIRLAVPALIAFLPQTAFYAIGNDMLTPITFGLAFLFLVKFWSVEKGGLVIALVAGLAIAAAYLTKTTSLPLLVAAGCFLAFRFLTWVVNDNLPKSSVPFFLLLIIALLPIAGWTYWCKTNFGDLTGSNPKIQYLGWTVKPVSEWLHHPLFTKTGAWFFVKQNIATFWQGEMLWQRQPLAIPGVDSAYVILTLGTLALTLAAWLYPRSPFTTTQWPAIGFALLCVLGSFAFFALLSIMYDFHDCFYPSKEKPFFVSGRLMLGMLVPFLILFACGLDRLMIRLQNITKFTLLLALLGFMIGSEITINGPIVNNDYNWFHM